MRYMRRSLDHGACSAQGRPNFFFPNARWQPQPKQRDVLQKWGDDARGRRGPLSLASQLGTPR
jgi:hypothetical protein